MPYEPTIGFERAAGSGLSSWGLSGPSSSFSPAPPARKGWREPLSGVQATVADTGYELNGGGVVDLGEYLRRSVESTRSWLPSMSMVIPTWLPPGNTRGWSFAAGELGAEDPRLAPLAEGFLIRLVNSSLNSGTICHFIPLPGSSVRRGIFWKALFSDRLCRMEF
jgi:hypothetical protein